MVPIKLMVYWNSRQKISFFCLQDENKNENCYQLYLMEVLLSIKRGVFVKLAKERWNHGCLLRAKPKGGRLI